MTRQFPDGFIWGTATAAHQVEGGNTASDLWFMEMAPRSYFTEPSGDACDHYHLYNNDLALLKGLGFGAYRFSIEWARIEPEEGFFSKAVLDHYRRMIADCRAIGLLPIVTFHHFTAPLWFTRDGGWEETQSVERFARYCERAGRALGDLIGYTCTINEANIPMLITAMRETQQGPLDRTKSKRFVELARRCGGSAERFAPYLHSDGHKASPNLIAAHRKGTEALKSAGLTAPIGVTLALHDMQADEGAESVRDSARYTIEDRFLEAAKGDDFVGVQTYTRFRFSKNGLRRPMTTRNARKWDTSFIPKRWKRRSGGRAASAVVPSS